MSQLAVNSITDGSGGATATINGYTPTASNMGGKNRIINGDMRIDQRNAGAAVTPTGSGYYYLDRWACGLSQASKFSIQRSTTAPSGFTNSAVITSLSSYSIGAGDSFALRQPIEGFNCADFAWGTADAKTVTLSFWVRSSLTGTFGGAINNSGNSRSYPFTYTVSSANTWEQKSVVIVGDTAGTWLTDNSLGLMLVFGLGVGSSLSGTSGAWAGANYLSATGATSVVGTSGATFYITGVQLEEGSVATPFEHRQYGQELALCQRYYEQITGIKHVSYAKWSNGNVYNFFPAKVTKRSAPTVNLISGSWVAYNVAAGFATSTPEVSSTTVDGFGVRSTVASSEMELYFNSTGFELISEL